MSSTFAVVKDDVGQIKRYAEIVIAETIVLLGVEHFKQRRRRVAAEVRANLVDLVEHDQGIVSARLLQRLDHTARHCANVSSTVSANFSFVVNSTQ